MKQGRMLIAACAAVMALCAVAPAIVAAAPKAVKAAASSTTRKNALRQFSGVVTALDKGSLTVEKSGKNPRTVVFARDPEMRTTGELEKNARVTVHYRDESGRMVAHRVVVKPMTGRVAKATKAASDN
jgi:7-keto-8-aminopelargonate synthetase-like enzyme